MGKRVLFVRMSYIGDILHATPAARMIKEAHPDWTLTWIVTPSLVDMLKENPYVDEVITWERDVYEAHSKKLHLATMWSMWWNLRKQIHGRFDIAVDVQGRLISGIVLAASGAPLRVGMGGTKELNWLFTNRKTRATYRHVIERYNQVAKLLAPQATASLEMVLRLNTSEIAWAHQALQGVTGKKTLGLVLGSSWPSKIWSLEYMHRLVEGLVPQVRVIYIGGPSEQAQAACLPQGTSIFNSVGKTSLRQTAALLAQCDVVVSADTGALHMASALGVPTVGLFGPTDPSEWGAVDNKAHTLRVDELPCLGCRKRKCPKGHHHCMTHLTVDRVKGLVQKILQDSI